MRLDQQEIHHDSADVCHHTLRAENRRQLYKLIKDTLTEEYLETKMKNDKIILGEGNFGKVKLAISLTGSISKPCDLICVKKSKKF